MSLGHQASVAEFGLAYGPVAAELHRRCFAEGWSDRTFAELLGLDGSFLLLAMAGAEEPAGFLLGRAVGGEAEILTLGILPEHRRGGLARRLVVAALALAARRGADCCFLEVAERNAAGQGLYGGLGFHQVGRRARYYSDGDAALVMRRDLAA